MGFLNCMQVGTDGRIVTAAGPVVAGDGSGAGFRYDPATGGVRTVAAVPTSFANGFGFKDGQLCIGAGPAVAWNGGVPLNAQGQLIADGVGGAIKTWCWGWPLSAAGVGMSGPGVGPVYNDRAVLHFEDVSTNIVDSQNPANSWSGIGGTQQTAQFYAGAKSWQNPSGARVYVTVTAASLLDFSRWAGFRMKLAVRPTSLAGTQAIIALWNGPSNYLLLVYQDPVQVVLNCTVAGSPNNMGSILHSASGFAANAWSTIEVVRSGAGAATKYKLTVNGVSVEGTVGAQPLVSGSQVLVLGMNMDGGSGSQNWAGFMDEMFLSEVAP